MVIKSIYLFFLLSFPVLGISQQLTFDDLVKMNGDKASEAKNHLPEKGKWVQESSTSNRSDSAVVVYKMEYNKEDKARHWVSVYSENDKPKSISYQTTNGDYIGKIEQDLVAAGYILANTRYTEHSKITSYKKDGVLVEITKLSAETNPGPVYLVTLNS